MPPSDTLQDYEVLGQAETDNENIFVVFKKLITELLKFDDLKAAGLL